VQPQTTLPTAAAPKPAPRQESLPAQTSPLTPAAPAPAPYAPAPPAYKFQYGSKAESMKAAPAAESYNRAEEAAEEMKKKSGRRLERQRDAAAPAAAGRAAGAPAGLVLPQALVRLSMDDQTAAPAMIREALLRSGGEIVDELDPHGQGLKSRLPAARQNELLERLARLGRIVERPATPPSGAQLLEITVRW